MPLPPHNYDMSLISKNFSQIVYRYTSEDAIILHNKYMKWRGEVGGAVAETLIDFRDTVVNIHKITNIPKFRSFQYRILMRGIVTNIQLYQWKMLENDNCYYCNCERETLSHLFYYCTEIRGVVDKSSRILTSRVQYSKYTNRYRHSVTK